MSTAAEEFWFSSDTLDRERWSGVAGPMLERYSGARTRNRLPQSLLIIGPQGLGRELAAVEAAALLTCPLPGPTFCPAFAFSVRSITNSVYGSSHYLWLLFFPIKLRYSG